MADLQTLVVGDSMTDMDVIVTDAAGVVKDLTGHEARVFLRGLETGDRPESTALSIAALSYATSAKTITRASGSFSSDGVLAGMVVVDANFPEGTVVVTPGTLTMTLNNAPIANGTTVAVKFWGGLLATITDAANGKIKVVSPGSSLNIAPAASESYRGRCSIRNTSTNKVGWTNDTIAVVEFRAVSA
jgi:hypothetical protein